MGLDDALRQFDRVETNLRRLEAVNEKLLSLIPEGINFAGSSPEGLEYSNLSRSFVELAEALPPIDGFTVGARPVPLDDIAQSRLDSAEISEPQILIDLGQEVGAPADSIAEYRHRFERTRKPLVLERVEALVAQVDGVLSDLTARYPDTQDPEVEGRALAASVAPDAEWVVLTECIAEIQRLLGKSTAGIGRWVDLNRHLAFGQIVDLRDIAMHDWPSVRGGIEAALYTEEEPLPVDMSDLTSVVEARPTGSVTTALDWTQLDEASCERLIFNLLSDAPGYENPQWLTNTRAPDRGRDLSVDRVIADSLSGSTRQRVLVQCKHWTTQSVGPTDVAGEVAKAELWTPSFDVVIIATSGRFTTDAVAWVETHNQTHKMSVEMWAESHLEMLLATRAYLVEEFGLRPPP